MWSQEMSESGAQWQYFGMPHKFFKNEIMDCSSFINDLDNFDTRFYRNILYAFCQYRQFIRFEFRRNRMEPGVSQLPFDIEVTFKNNYVRRKFLATATMSHPQRRMEFSNKQLGVLNFSRRLNDLIQRYFYQFVNDLVTVSQPAGYELFTSIYSPALVKSYYNVMGISSIVMNEYNKLLQWYGLDHEFVQSIGAFLSQNSQDLSQAVYFFIWAKIGRDSGYPQDLFILGLMQKFQWQRADFYNEMMFLDHHFSGLRDKFKTGPTTLVYNPSIKAGKHFHQKTGLPTPSYQRITFPNCSNIIEKFKQFRWYLADWTSSGERKSRLSTAFPRSIERRRDERESTESSRTLLVVEQSNVISSSNMSNDNSDYNRGLSNSSSASPILKEEGKNSRTENADKPNLETKKSGQQIAATIQNCDVPLQTEPQDLKKDEHIRSTTGVTTSNEYSSNSSIDDEALDSFISELDFAITGIANNKAHKLSNEITVPSKLNQSFEEESKRSLGNEAGCSSKAQISPSPMIGSDLTKKSHRKKKSSNTEDEDEIPSGKKRKTSSEERSLKKSSHRKSHRSETEYKSSRQEASPSREEKLEQLAPASPEKDNSIDVSGIMPLVKFEPLDSPLSPGKDYDDLPLTLVNGTVLRKIKLETIYNDEVIKKEFDNSIESEKVDEHDAKSTATKLHVPEVIIKSECVDQTNPSLNEGEICSADENDLESDTKRKFKKVESNSIKSRKNLKKTDLEISSKNQAHNTIDNVQDTLLYQSISVELTKFMNTTYYKSQFDSRKRSGSFREKDKETFLRFLFEHQFLCEVMNPLLPKILCSFKFLGRRETTPYKNFVSDLRFNLSSQLENLFTKSCVKSIKFGIYENLRKKFG